MATQTRRRSGVVTAPKRDLEQTVTQAIIDQLDKGTVPWRKPWTGTGGHRNLVSGKTYRGVNPMLLEIACIERGFTDSRWLTFKQLKALGGELIGEKGDPERTTTLVVFWKVVDEDRNGKKLDRPYRLLRHYNVFNVEQTTLDLAPQEEPEPFVAHAAAQAVMDHMPRRPKITWGGDRAAYSPVLDLVQLPSKEAFEDRAAYYATAFHELAHSTGHETRVGRDLSVNFGSEPYAKEELVAELTGAMLCAHTGLADERGIEQSAAYIAGWLKALKNDKGLVVSAAAAAQRATDFILDTKFEVA